MKSTFTPSMGLAVAGNKKITRKKQRWFILIPLLVSCCVITGYAQVEKKPGKPTLKDSNGSDQFKAWLTTGNIGTNPSKNFIGTLDAQPLIFRVNNQRSGLIDFDDFTQTTAFGYQTLISNVPSTIDGNTNGIGNSAFGYQALTTNISGELNTALGQQALRFNTEGDINTAVGAYCLWGNSTGAFNTAIGSFALSSNSEGSFNTATGDFALANNTTGSFNIASGPTFTLGANTEGSENIATGAISMTNNSTGNANVAYGVFSLATNETGSNNSAFGSHADVTAGDLNNATAIGAGALTDASNKVSIGNTDVTSIGGQVGWTSFSDERVKDNIKENVPGLEFIKALRPVTYHFSIAKESKLLGIKEKIIKDFPMPQLNGIKVPGINHLQMPAVKYMATTRIKEAGEHKYEIEKIQFTGFLAQDVEKAAENIGYDFSGIDKSGKLMGLRYGDFVVPLVKAVQELSKQNEDLQKQIAELKALMKEASKNSVALSDASVGQNMPNPFRQKTSINYTLPVKYVKAQIIITDKTGNTLKQINISGNGKGMVNIDAATLSAGAYSYTLVVDGHLIETKNMLLVK